jgi:hypothetical protein
MKCNFIVQCQHIKQSFLVPSHIQSLAQQAHWKAKCRHVSSLQYQNNSNCLFQVSSFSENNNNVKNQHHHTAKSYSMKF